MAKLDEGSIRVVLMLDGENDLTLGRTLHISLACAMAEAGISGQVHVHTEELALNPY